MRISDWSSDVCSSDLPVPTLTLATEIPARDFAARLAKLPPEKRAEVEAGLKNVEAVDIPSKLMTGFSGRATSIKGWVALPPGYKEGKDAYPTAYSDGEIGRASCRERGSRGV